MRVLTSIACSIAALSLAACTFTPTVISAGERNVTYRIPPERLAETQSAAERYCRERGSTARLEGVTPTGEGRSVAAFACY